MYVPSIDKNAKLKIEEVKTVEELPVSEKKGIVIFVLGSIISLLVIGATVGLGYFYFSMPVKEEEKVVATSPTPMVTEAPRKVEIVFEVQNATGTAGLGSKAKTKIEAVGYKVITVGNGSGKHTGNELYLQKSVVDQKDDILTKLKTDFPKINYIGELVESTATARLILGK